MTVAFDASATTPATTRTSPAPIGAASPAWIPASPRSIRGANAMGMIVSST
jgi:hypothetical protein